MVSKNIELLPEVLAILTFVPLGIFMGFITNFVVINELAATNILYYIEQWPYVVSSFCAIGTGVLLTFGRFKQKQDRYRFEHFYILIFGMFFVMLGGIILVSSDKPYAGLFIIFAGKGVCYIAALSYLNIRIGKTRYRMLKLSLPHWVYLFGVAIGATVTTVSTDDPYYVWIHYKSVVEVESILIIASSFMLLCAYLATEALQRQKQINYKRSLDDDINRENECGEIFVNKYFLIMEPRSEAQAEQMINAKQERNSLIAGFSIILAVLGKIGGIAYFYAPFMFIYLFGALVKDFEISLWVINWYGMLGITASLVLLCWGQYKLHFLLSCGIKMFILTIGIGVIANDDYFESLKVLYSFVFVILAFGYGYCDINILSYTNLKYNEIILALGYSIQYITIGVMQYYTIYKSTLILDFARLSSFYLTFPHAISFAVFFIYVALVAIFLLPNRSQLSLLEIKNAINRKFNVNLAASVLVGHPNNNLPQQQYPAGSQVGPPQGVMPGTNYPQYYPAPHPYPQQQYNPHPAAPPPNYEDVYAGQIPFNHHITRNDHKITEL